MTTINALDNIVVTDMCHSAGTDVTSLYWWSRDHLSYRPHLFSSFMERAERFWRHKTIIWATVRHSDVQKSSAPSMETVRQSDIWQWRHFFPSLSEALISNCFLLLPFPIDNFEIFVLVNTNQVYESSIAW